MTKYTPTFFALFFTLTAFSQNWTSLGQGLNKQVETLLPDTATNLLYAGGEFDSSGTIQLNHVGFWDGVQWNALGSGFDGLVMALAIYNGELYATGNFTHSDTSSLNYIAKWDGANWVNVGGGLNGTGLSLFNFNGDLYAGGNFTRAGNQPCKYIAKWDGVSWQSLDTNIVSTNSGFTLMSIGSFQNELVIGGNFIAEGNANNISILKSGIWQPLSTGTNSWITSMQELNNELIVTGFFNQAGSVASICIAKWNGSSWLPFPGLASSLVLCNTIINNNLVFGGYSNSFLNGSISSHCIANYNLTNQNWSGISTGMTNSVNALATMGNVLYAGGQFDTAGAFSIKNIAKIDATTLSIKGNLQVNTQILIYPNPAADVLNVKFTLQQSAPVKLALYDITGRNILTTDPINKSDGNITLNTTAIPAGIYFLKLESGNNKVVRKVAIEK